MHPPAKFPVLLLSVQEWAPKRYNGSFFPPRVEPREGGGMNELRPAQKKVPHSFAPSPPPSLLRHYNVTWFEWEDAWWCGVEWCGGGFFLLFCMQGLFFFFFFFASVSGVVCHADLEGGAKANLRRGGGGGGGGRGGGGRRRRRSVGGRGCVG